MCTRFSVDTAREHFPEIIAAAKANELQFVDHDGAHGERFRHVGE